MQDDGVLDVLLVLAQQGVDDGLVLLQVPHPVGGVLHGGVHGHAHLMDHDGVVHIDQDVVVRDADQIGVEGGVDAVFLHIGGILRPLEHLLEFQQTALGVERDIFAADGRFDQLTCLVKVVDALFGESGDPHPLAREDFDQALRLKHEERFPQRRSPEGSLLQELFFVQFLPGQVFAGYYFII